MLLTLGKTESVNRSASCFKAFLNSLMKAVNCSLWSSALSSTIDSPTTECLMLMKNCSKKKFSLIYGNHGVYFCILYWYINDTKREYTQNLFIYLLKPPWIFFGFVFGISQAKSIPSKWCFWINSLAEFMNVSLLSTASNWKNTNYILNTKLVLLRDKIKA